MAWRHHETNEETQTVHEGTLHGLHAPESCSIQTRLMNIPSFLYTDSRMMKACAKAQGRDFNSELHIVESNFQNEQIKFGTGKNTMAKNTNWFRDKGKLRKLPDLQVQHRLVTLTHILNTKSKESTSLRLLFRNTYIWFVNEIICEIQFFIYLDCHFTFLKKLLSQFQSLKMGLPLKELFIIPGGISQQKRKLPFQQEFPNIKWSAKFTLNIQIYFTFTFIQNFVLIILEKTSFLPAPIDQTQNQILQLKF